MVRIGLPAVIAGGGENVKFHFFRIVSGVWLDGCLCPGSNPDRNEKNRLRMLYTEKRQNEYKHHKRQSLQTKRALFTRLGIMHRFNYGLLH